MKMPDIYTSQLKSEDFQEGNIIYMLLKRAEIRRSIPTRKSVQESKPDRIAELLEIAAEAIDERNKQIEHLEHRCYSLSKQNLRLELILGSIPDADK